MAERSWRRVLRSVAGCLIVVVVIGFMIRWFEHRQVFIPYSAMEATGKELGRPHEDVYLETRDGVRINAWFYPAASNSVRAELAVLLFHGNAGNMSHRLHVYDALLKTGVNLFTVDYRGYGRSKGRPAEEGTYLDAEAAYGWLCKRGLSPSNVIVLGKSLGGGVASELATRVPVGGLILQNTFSSITDVGKEMFPWLPVRTLTSIRYATVEKLPRIQVPIMIMHSRTDQIIGFGHAERNLAAANDPKLFWELEGSHNETIESEGNHFLKGLETYLNQYFK